MTTFYDVALDHALQPYRLKNGNPATKLASNAVKHAIKTRPPTTLEGDYSYDEFDVTAGDTAALYAKATEKLVTEIKQYRELMRW